MSVADLIDARAYHADRTRDSFSSLMLFAQSPALYYHRRVTGRIPEPEPTDALRLGTATHIAILEPERLPELLAVAPESVLSKSGSRAGKAYEEWSSEQGGRVIVKQDELDRIRWQIETVWENRAARELLEACPLREHVVTWDGEIPAKARFDACDEWSGLVLDLKTARDPGPDWWRSVKDYGYHRQTAWYADGFAAEYRTTPPLVAHLVVGSSPPYDCFVWTLPGEAVTRGRWENSKTCAELRECRAGTRPWTHALSGARHELELPEFFYR